MAVALDHADALATTVVQTMKTLRGLRQHLPKPAAGVEHSAYPVLFVLANGPARVSAIADQVESDISTVSRQVGQLIDADLAVKASDPDDGRAQLVALTDAGKDAIARSRELRAEFFRTVLDDWSDAEVTEFHAALHRFRDALMGATTPSSAKESA